MSTGNQLPTFWSFCHLLQDSPRTVSCMEEMVCVSSTLWRNEENLPLRIHKFSMWPFSGSTDPGYRSSLLFSVDSPSSFISLFFAPHFSYVPYPQLHQLHNAVSPLVSLNQSPNPQFPYIMHHLFDTIHSSWTVLREVASSSETPVTNYRLTWCGTPKDFNLHQQSCK